MKDPTQPLSRRSLSARQYRRKFSFYENPVHDFALISTAERLEKFRRFGRIAGQFAEQIRPE